MFVASVTMVVTKGAAMDRNKAEAMLAEARAELLTAESAVTYLKQVVTGLQGLLNNLPVSTPVFTPEGAAPLTPSPESAGTEDALDVATAPVYPRTPEAVLEVLRARPNFPMSFKALWAEMNQRGLVDPTLKSGRNAYTNAARRLADDPSSAVHRDEYGRYLYRTDDPAAAPLGPSLFLARVSENARSPQGVAAV